MEAANLGLKNRFLAMVNKTDTCWLWAGTKCLKGYGKIGIHGKTQRAHRVSWMLFNHSNISSKDLILHKCDVPSCVNPDHLYVGDAKQNGKDRDSRGRNFYLKKTHCDRGHEFTPKNTHKYKNKRVCRLCKAARARSYYQNKKINLSK
jgi:hypothetical protein